MAKEEIKKEEVKTPEIKKKETVTIPKDTLDDLMARLKRVESAADKSRLYNFDEKNKQTPNKIVKLKKIFNKIVISWDNMVQDVVEKNENGVWKEKQTIRLNLEGGESKDIPYVEFVKHAKVLFCEVISKTVENAGTPEEKTILKVVNEDGKEYNIDKTFVN